MFVSCDRWCVQKLRARALPDQQNTEARAKALRYKKLHTSTVAAET